MKKVLMALVVTIMAVGFTLPDAEARRMGGGGSFGKQSSSARQAPAQSSQASNTAKSNSQAAAAPKSSAWKGMLGGALLGLGLGALLSSMGLGGAMASMISTILMVALLAFAAMFIYRMVMRKSAASGPRPAYARADSGYTPAIGSHLESVPTHARHGAPLSSAEPVSYSPWGVPTDFDTNGFLRHAKTYFIRLQAAWDKGDEQDIRGFTTPEMFAEIKMQTQERGAAANHTDVVSLDAELLGIETAADEYLASVRFTGMIRESDNAPAEPFTEIWNLSKPVEGDTGWLLAGIQQSS